MPIGKPNEPSEHTLIETALRVQVEDDEAECPRTNEVIRRAYGRLYMGNPHDRKCFEIDAIRCYIRREKDGFCLGDPDDGFL